MSRSVALHRFPTLYPDIPVKAALGIGRQKSTGKTLQIVLELDMKHRVNLTKSEHLKKGQSQETVLKDVQSLNFKKEK